MRKKTEKGKLRQQKLQEGFEKRRIKRLAEIDRLAVGEAKKLLNDCIKNINEVADQGGSLTSFGVKKVTDPTPEEEYEGIAIARHLARLLEKRGFKAITEHVVSEGNVDDTRNIYWYQIQINW